MAVRYVWLNLMTGQFGKSWTKDQVKAMPESEKTTLMKAKKLKRWALIRYETLNGDDFEFTDDMRITDT